MSNASTTAEPGSLNAAVDAARADAARRTGLSLPQLVLLSAESVTWSDGSLGCPQPGRMYAQALVAGYRIRIRAGAEVLDYHASHGAVPQLCPKGQAIDPAAGKSRI